MDFEETDVQGRYYHEDGGCFEEHTIGSVDLHIFNNEKVLPDEIEIEGYFYIREDKKC